MDRLVAEIEPLRAPGIPGLGRLVDDLAAAGRGLIMVMGKEAWARRPLRPRWPWGW